MKILIAEDDPLSTRMLTTILTKWGHEVVTTTKLTSTHVTGGDIQIR